MNSPALAGTARPGPGTAPLTVGANALWNMAGTTAYAACQWGILVVLARMGSREMVGEYAFALAVCNPVILFANLNLRELQATDAREEFRFSVALRLRSLTSAIALVVLVALAVASGMRGPLVLVLVALAKTVESFGDLAYGALQRHERMDRISISMILKGLLSLGAVAVALRATGALAWGMAGLAAAWTLVLFAWDAPCTARVLRTRTPSGGKTVAQLFRLALPLGFVILLVTLVPNIPRYAIQKCRGAGDLGIFAAMQSLAIAGSTIVGAAGHAGSPALARFHAAGDFAAFRGLVFRLLGLAALAGAAAFLLVALAGGPLMALLFGPGYSEELLALRWTMAGAGLTWMSSILNFANTAARRLAIQIPLFCAVALAVAVASILLVPRLGLTGAAQAATAGAAVHLVLAALVARRATLPPARDLA